MKLFFRKIKSKIIAIAAIIKAPGILEVQLVDEEALLKAQISDALFKMHKPKDTQEHEFFMKIIDQITSELIKKKSFTERVNDTNVNELFRNATWFYMFLCGLGAWWEFRVKILAARLNIKLGRKKLVPNGEGWIIKYRDLDLIIKDMEALISRNIELNLHQLRKIRNPLLHGNFQQLKEETNTCFPDLAHEHDGNVIATNFEDPPLNLSGSLTEKEVEEQDIYGWFIEGINSKLMKNIFDKYEQSLFGIGLLIDLKAHSFDGRESYFKKLIKNGAPLSKTEEEEYIKYSQTNNIHPPINKNFFDELYKHVGLR